MTLAIATHTCCGTAVVGKRVDGELQPYCPTCARVVRPSDLNVKGPLAFLFSRDDQAAADLEVNR